MHMKIAQDLRNEQGAWLFIVSLAVFFLSCVLLYAIYVVTRIAPPGGLSQPFVLPINFITTTVVLIAISICLHLSVGAIQRERRVDVWRYIIIASILNVVFFGMQSTGMLTLIQRLQESNQQDRSLYGFTFLMVLIHALHVVGGSAGLVFIMFGLSRESYDHERYWPIKFCAIYWHFLDVVWILMLASFALAAFASK